MEISVSEAKASEVLLNIKEEDISVMYILQHELLSSKKVGYAGFALRHPLTMEYEMRIVAESGNPLDALVESTKSAGKYIEDLSKLVKSKLRD